MARVFQNPLLERLTHVHPATPLLLWGPVIALLLWRAFLDERLAASSVLGIGLAAIFFWTLSEYLIHRFVFHLHSTTRFGARVQFLLHGLHHDEPNDATRLVMPPVASILLAIPFYLLFRLVLGPIWAGPFFAFFLIGYLCYDYIHYGAHHFRPQTAVGKWLKRHHMQHHFVSQNCRWGVSSPLWDLVFGTLEDPGATDHPAGAAPSPNDRARGEARRKERSAREAPRRSTRLR